MPIVDVELLQDTTLDTLADDLPQRIADALGEVFQSQPAQTWVKVHYHPRAHYAENHSILPFETKPVMIKILKYQIPEPHILKEETQRVAESVAAICACPVENVHVLYEPEAKGRIAFGGTLRT